MSATTPESYEQLAELTGSEPDRKYFKREDGTHEIVSWDCVTVDGVAATVGIIQPGVDRTIEVDPRGERIRLFHPSPGEGLVISYPSAEDPHRTEMAVLQDTEKEVSMRPGRMMRILTHQDLAPVTYICEFR